MKISSLLFVFVLTLSVSTFGQSKQEKPLTRMLLILDGSNSMNGVWENNRTKIDIARRLLLKMVDSLSKVPNLELALRMYGHQSPVPPQDCNDTRLEVPFSPNNTMRIIQKLNAMKPKGTTPIAKSLEACANDFPPCDNCRNIIMLITDGIEACDGDPCAVALALQRKGIILKPFIIGIGLDVDFVDAFSCIPDFYNANGEESLQKVISLMVSNALEATTAQINLNDINKKPTETNVNMTFYDADTKLMRDNLIHTLNIQKLPDTLVLDPIIKYDIEIHTIPPVKLRNVVVEKGMHNIIEANTPQGSIIIKEKYGDKLEVNNVKVIVRQNDEFETLNVQSINTNEKYLTGRYDLEVLTLPRLFYYNIEVAQSKTATIEVDQPGMITFSFPTKGYGSLYVLKGDRAEWVCNLNDIFKTTLPIQPGDYMLIYRRAGVYNTQLTKKRLFTVKSGFSMLVQP